MYVTGVSSSLANRQPAALPSKLVSSSQGLKAGLHGIPFSRYNNITRVVPFSRYCGVPIRSRRYGGTLLVVNAQQLSKSQPADPDDEEITQDEDGCAVFIDPQSGDFIQPMCCDYGFRSGVMRMYSEDDGRIPASVFSLGWQNFKKEYRALRRSIRFDEYAQISDASFSHGPIKKSLAMLGSFIVRSFSAVDKQLEDSKIFSKIKPRRPPPEVIDTEGGLIESCSKIRSQLKRLTLSDEAVNKREKDREKAGKGIKTVWPIRLAYVSLCWMLDVLYENRPIQRFWVLETVARMPYFSYISMLHLYESLGWWRAAAELRKVHFAEEWNELHHLMIMEALGGDQLWADRFLAQHAAVFYYWVLILMFLLSPALAYNFSELVESHAVDTYGQFVEENEKLLKSMPPPLVALEYYRGDDLYMFDYFQTGKRTEPRRPACSNLYDVFINIRDDEGEHVKTMRACQDNTIMADLRDNMKALAAQASYSMTPDRTVDMSVDDADTQAASAQETTTATATATAEKPTVSSSVSGSGSASGAIGVKGETGKNGRSNGSH